MFKVVMWDYTGESDACAKCYMNDNVEVIRTLYPNDPDQAEVIMRGDWDFVLIFEQGQREYFDEIFKIMQAMKVSTENIIFAKDFQSLSNNPAAIYALFKPSAEVYKHVQRHQNFWNHKHWHKYIAASAEGLNYVSSAQDMIITYRAYVNNENFSSNNIKIFRELSKRYYNIDVSGGGIFLDLGANIGTTGLYFLKKFAPDMRLIAFEPDAENFKLLRINSILNDLQDRTTLVNCGLGDKFDEMTMYRDLINPGANSVVFRYRNNMPSETIKIIPLDAYFAENKIAAQEIKYIWIDTEGYEAQVLLGAKNLLAQNPAPIFMECNLRTWDNSGHFENMMSLLAKYYSHFILFTLNGNEHFYPLEALPKLERPVNHPLGQLGDIFLIRKGTID